MAKLNGSRRARVNVGSGDVRAALRVRFAAPAFAMFEEVGNATGFACDRHADAVVISLWPSRGIWFHGLEIKVSRQDWLKELAQPAKADAIAKHCDYWSVVTGDESIIRPGELPEAWGHITLRGDKLFTLKEAPKAAEVEPARGFVVALLRRAHETLDTRMSDAFRRGRAEGVADGNPDELAQFKRANETLKAEIDAFEAASGIKIQTFRGAALGDAVRRILQFRNSYVPDPGLSLEQAASRLEINAATLRAEAAKLRAQKEIALDAGDDSSSAVEVSA